jgi:predicted nucleic acid-binding protein
MFEVCDRIGTARNVATTRANALANIFWDTNLFIYLLEDSPTWGSAVKDLRRRMIRRGDQLFTSAMTVGEILVKPLAVGNAALVDRYRKFFTSSHLTVSPFDVGAAEAYAQIRQDRTIQPADGLQLACAISADADLFITNDDRLSQRNVPGVGFFITSLSRAPL